MGQLHYNKKCFNCESELKPSQQYCSNCGEETDLKKKTFWDFLSEITSGLFNLDGILIRSLKSLCVPAFLTKVYFQGKRKKYVAPGRLLLFSSLIFFALIKLKVSPALQFESTIKTSLINTAVNEKVNLIRDSFSMRLYQHYDTTTQQEILLELKKSRHSVLQNSLDSVNGINLNIGERQREISAWDLLVLNPSEILDKYNIIGFFERLSGKQAIKTITSGNQLLNAILSNLSWAVLLSVPMMAFVYYLVYIRHEKYYIEHLIFTSHIFSFLLILASINALITYLFFYPALIYISILIFIIYILLAIYRYYKNSISKTIFKFFILSFGLFIILNVNLLIIVGLSFFLF